jgi:1-acyl-sn-glycerol-3-phosphate acyltransferase
VRRALRTAERIVRGVGVALTTVSQGRLSPPPSIRHRAARLQLTLAELVEIHGLRVAVHGEFPDGPAIYVANHVSYLDPIVIGAQRGCAAIAKGEVERWPVLGPACGHLGVIFVNREDPHSGARALRRAHAALRAGVPVLNFPEGTTTDGTRLLPFRRGIFGLARIAGVPVVPIAIRCASPALTWTGGATFLPHYLRTAARRAPAVELTIGAAIRPGWFKSAGELAAFTHARVAQLLRGEEEVPDAATIVRRVPAPRPDPVLPAPRRRLAAAR